MSRVNEIGSEYCLSRSEMKLISTTSVVDVVPPWIDVCGDKQLLFSGRTAIDYVLQDVEHNGCKSRVAYVPSYCCDSMLQPFLGRGWQLVFYDVSLQQDAFRAYVDEKQDCGILLICNYFGNNVVSDCIINSFRDRGTIVLADFTHSLFNADNVEFDYAVISLRKWFNIASGGLAVKRYGTFMRKILRDNQYVGSKYEAMMLKAEYLDTCQGSKQNFLEMFYAFNSALTADYIDYDIDDISKRIIWHLNIPAIKQQRYSNGLLLNDYLEKSKLFVSLCKSSDCHIPLFVPVLVKGDLRNTAKQYLINHHIYCPNHWPKPSSVCVDSSDVLYTSELSLICDQRYSSDDMRYVVKTLEEFEQKYL